MRLIDPKSGERIEWAPRSVCNFEPVSASAAAMTASTLSAEAVAIGATSAYAGSTAALATTAAASSAIPWTMIGAVASIAGAGMSLVGGLSGAAGSGLESQQLQEEAENARVAAEQDEAQRRKNLSITLATQDAIRAGRGVDLYSPTGINIRENTIAEAEDDISTSRLNYLNKQRRYLIGSAQAEAEGTGKIIGGVAGAASGIGQAGGTLSRSTVA